MSTFLWKHRVQESEIDELGHASNVIYVQWMQEAAVAHSIELGFTPSVHLTMGTGWVVRNHKVEYLQSAYVDEEIGIYTWVSSMDRIKSMRQYEIYNLKKQLLLARAETLWAYIHYEKMRPSRIPDEIAEAFGSYGSRPEPSQNLFDTASATSA